jgi:hypothetical protein
MNNPELSSLTTGLGSHWSGVGESEIQRFLAESEWEKIFSSEELVAIRKATESLKQVPWLCATSDQARSVAVSAMYPRSCLGAKQFDWLTRVIYAVRDRCPDINSAAREIVEIVTTSFNPSIADAWIRHAPDGSLFWLIGRLHSSLGFDGSFQPKTGSELFGAIAEGIQYLESYKPTAGDYAIEALQGAFVGLMQKNYAWGKKGRPTKGDVIEMAKARLQERKKKTDFAKSSWSEFLKAAQLDWLPAGQARRPSKASLDENVKAEREYLSLCKQAIKDIYGGDPKRARDSVKAAFGNKAEYRRSEEDRLRGVQPNSEQDSE